MKPIPKKKCYIIHTRSNATRRMTDTVLVLYPFAFNKCPAGVLIPSIPNLRHRLQFYFGTKINTFICVPSRERHLVRAFRVCGSTYTCVARSNSETIPWLAGGGWVWRRRLYLECPTWIIPVVMTCLCLYRALMMTIIKGQNIYNIIPWGV